MTTTELLASIRSIQVAEITNYNYALNHSDADMVRHMHEQICIINTLARCFDIVFEQRMFGVDAMISALESEISKTNIRGVIIRNQYGKKHFYYLNILYELKTMIDLLSCIKDE